MNLAPPLAQGLAELGLALPAASQRRLLDYVSLLQKWNTVYNLTAIREPGKMVTHHLLDSLAVAPHVSGATVVDVGSGAGLPGIPLALALPRAQVSLLDASQKKTAFLRQAVTELGLTNATVACERAESWRPPQLFDFVVSRAFAELGDFVARAAHLMAPSGVLAAMKGAYPGDEISRLPAGWVVRRVVVLQGAPDRAARHLVLIGTA
jgi:16S rRNA (guanine527-N7)-methyltransferase